jgi:uncharacterized protein YceH (UPF0502 family)
MTFDPVPVRVLGALIEKEITTPEAYPLSLNALINACNQKSSRDPVMDLDEETVRQALHALEDFGLVAVSRDARVPKFEHRARTVFNLRRDETAILCLLMLRGPQTPGELRSRSDRMYSFDDLQAIESTLARLSLRAPQPASPGTSNESTQSDDPACQALVVLLPRQPGSREARWMHLLGGSPEASDLGSAATARIPVGSNGAAQNAGEERMAALEAEVASLRDAIAALERKLESLVH